MRKGLYTIDFHTHLQDQNLPLKMCPEERDTPLFKFLSPLFDRLATTTEPVHDHCVRFMALNMRDRVSRELYAHLGKIGLMEVLRLFRQNSIGQLIARMDRNGIDHSVIHSIEPLTSTAAILEIVEAHRERVSVFASVDKNNSDPVGYLRPFVESGTVSGLKIHPIVGQYDCGELFFRMKDVVALARDANLPVLIHTGHIPVDRLKGIGGCSEIEALEPLVKHFPEVRFILAHIGWESWRQVLEFAQRYDNVLVETSWQPARVIRRSVDLLGSSRVLFGSDFPLFNQTEALASVRKALTEKELVEVVSVNGMRLLNLNTDRISQFRNDTNLIDQDSKSNLTSRKAV